MNDIIKLMCLCCLVLVFTSCHYTWKDAEYDASHPRRIRRKKSFEYFSKYITKNMGKKKKEQIHSRRLAIRSIGETGLPKAINVLRLILTHESVPELRVEAIRSLVILKARDALKEIRENLEHQDRDVRIAASDAIGALKDRGALKILKKVQKDPVAYVRIAVLRAMVSLDVSFAIPFLLQALGSNDSSERNKASLLLKKCGKESIESLIDSMNAPDLEKPVRDLLLRFGNKAIPGLIRALGKKDVRDSAASLLTTLTSGEKSWQYLGKLIEMGENKNRDTKKMNVLLNHLSFSSSAFLFQAIAPHWTVFPIGARRGFSRVLGKSASRIQGRSILLLQKEVLKTKDIALKSTFIRSLGYTGSDALPVLRRFLSSETKILRYAAIEAMGRVGEQSIPDLRPLSFSMDTELRIRAIWAIGKTRSHRAFRLLKKQIHHPDEEVRIAVAEAFYFLKDMDTIPALYKMAFDRQPKVKLHAYRALFSMGQHRIFARYLKAQKRVGYPAHSIEIRAFGQMNEPKVFAWMKEGIKRYLSDWKKYIQKAEKMHRDNVDLGDQKRSLSERSKQSILDVNRTLISHPASQRKALCSVLESMEIFAKMKVPIKKYMSKLGYHHTHLFNPLLDPSRDCSRMHEIRSK